MQFPIPDKKIVAITGYARSGKDTVAELIKENLKISAPNLKVEKFSFAASLRVELDDFIKTNFNGISAWTEDDKEKKIIRPLLIAYGNAKRELSNHQYWIEKIHKKIERSDCDVALITDLRFAVDENDELGWLKKNKGINFHLKRYRFSAKTVSKKAESGMTKYFEKAPNEFEKENDPKLEANAKKVIELPRFKTLQEFQAAAKEEVENIIGFFL